VRKLILYSAVSLDNRIAREDGSVQWLDAPQFTIPDQDFGHARFFAGIDTTIMGSKTYDQALSFGPPYPFVPTANFVLTRSSRRDKPDTLFLKKGIPDFVRALKRRKGKNIWLVGGGKANAFLLNHELIDRMILTFIPVVLGSGIPLFAGRVRPAKVALTGRKVFANGFVQVTWERR
jgi:dihydrofolate reductase